MTSLLALPRGHRPMPSIRIRALERGDWVPVVGTLGWELATSHPMWGSSKPAALRSLRVFLRRGVAGEGYWWLDVVDVPAARVEEADRRWVETPWVEWCASGR